VLPKKGGKDPFPRLLQRGKLPRVVPAVSCRPALVIGGGGGGGGSQQSHSRNGTATLKQQQEQRQSQSQALQGLVVDRQQRDSGGGGAGAGKGIRNSSCAADGCEFYGECDLHIGAIINVYNRPVLLIDMDEFTRRWYCARYGVGTEAVQPIEVSRWRWVRVWSAVLGWHTLQ